MNEMGLKNSMLHAISGMHTQLKACGMNESREQRISATNNKELGEKMYWNELEPV